MMDYNIQESLTLTSYVNLLCVSTAPHDVDQRGPHAYVEHLE